MAFNIQQYLIPWDTAEEGFKEWMTRHAQKNLNRHFKNKAAVRHAISDKSEDFMKRITMQKTVNTLYKALMNNGSSVNTDVRANKNYKSAAKETWQVAKAGRQYGTHTVNGVTFIIIGDPTMMNVAGLKINQIRYLSTSGEVVLNIEQVRKLIAPYFE